MGLILSRRRPSQPPREFPSPALDLILAHIPSDEYHATLSSLCRVNKACQVLAVKWLYKEVVLHVGLGRAGRKLIASPEKYRKYIKQVTLTGFRSPKPESYPLIWTFLHSCPNLTTLLSHALLSWCPPLALNPLPLCLSPELNAPDPATFFTLPNLTTLSVYLISRLPFSRFLGTSVYCPGRPRKTWWDEHDSYDTLWLTAPNIKHIKLRIDADEDWELINDYGIEETERRIRGIDTLEITADSQFTKCSPRLKHALNLVWFMFKEVREITVRCRTEGCFWWTFDMDSLVADDLPDNIRTLRLHCFRFLRRKEYRLLAHPPTSPPLSSHKPFASFITSLPPLSHIFSSFNIFLERNPTLQKVELVTGVWCGSLRDTVLRYGETPLVTYTSRRESPSVVRETCCATCEQAWVLVGVPGESQDQNEFDASEEKEKAGVEVMHKVERDLRVFEMLDTGVGGEAEGWTGTVLPELVVGKGRQVLLKMERLDMVADGAGGGETDDDDDDDDTI